MSDKNIYPLETLRHSFAHLLAQAVQRTVDPHAQLGTGPSIEHGFYYDMKLSEDIEFGEKQLKELTKQIKQIAKEPQSFVLYECALSHGYEINSLTNQDFKDELLDKFKEAGEETISYYLNVVPVAVLDNLRNAQDGYAQMYREVSNFFVANGTIADDQAVMFLDLCAWPHITWTTKEDLDVNGMKLEKLAGAYRQADDTNDMMTRIYGLAFENKELLQAHELMMEEAKKRDHRVLGEQMKLFTISPLVWAGMPLLQPNGMILRNEIINYLRELHKARGYQQVWTPHLAKEDLYVCSGHAEKFGDELFRVKGKDENDNFFMKPMNCPHHMQIFADNQFSYRDMPIRYFEPGTVYRDEKKGQLSGLTRVRSITQDDGHLFCRISQLKEEVLSIVEIIKTFYTTVGMVDEYRVSLSVRGDDGKLYLGTDEVREAAETALHEAAETAKLPYKRIEWEAAFYGPKLDFMFKDAIGRERQLATIQADFNLPERFDLSYINEEGDKERPVVIHRAISGSIERFMWVMIEHFAWAFPVRLAPTQVIILPVAEPFFDYAAQVSEQLSEAWLRVKTDLSNDSLNKMIRNAEKSKIPYILVVGEKEVAGTSVSVREFRSKQQYEMPVQEFVDKVKEEKETRAL